MSFNRYLTQKGKQVLAGIDRDRYKDGRDNFKQKNIQSNIINNQLTKQKNSLSIQSYGQYDRKTQHNKFNKNTVESPFIDTSFSKTIPHTGRPDSRFHYQAQSRINQPISEKKNHYQQQYNQHQQISICQSVCCFILGLIFIATVIVGLYCAGRYFQIYIAKQDQNKFINSQLKFQKQSLTSVNNTSNNGISNLIGKETQKNLQKKQINPKVVNKIKQQSQNSGFMYPPSHNLQITSTKKHLTIPLLTLRRFPNSID